ncbi:MAG TPA: hypothetical protein VHT31_06880, partial [Candidatus Acidoferrum sp.]|nr:hypothetical protein [Candidatus Acidoferrum sp.]
PSPFTSRTKRSLNSGERLSKTVDNQLSPADVLVSQAHLRSYCGTVASATGIGLLTFRLKR